MATGYQHNHRPRRRFDRARKGVLTDRERGYQLGLQIGQARDWVAPPEVMEHGILMQLRQALDPTRCSYVRVNYETAAGIWAGLSAIRKQHLLLRMAWDNGMVAKEPGTFPDLTDPKLLDKLASSAAERGIQVDQYWPVSDETILRYRGAPPAGLTSSKRIERVTRRFAVGRAALAARLGPQLAGYIWQAV